jgi:hypothetical protein
VNPTSPSAHGRFTVFRDASIFACAAFAVESTAATADAAKNPWSITASLTARESYDSNVFMQRTTARANHDSLVTTVIPASNLTWKSAPRLALTVGYAPEITRYARASSENNVAHKAALTLSGESRAGTWELGNTVALVNGDGAGPVFTGQGGAAIVGGVPLMERRDQRVLRQNLKAQIPFGQWFVRPGATTYVHDFRTAPRTTAGYQNYIDRNEFSAGLDLGRKIPGGVALIAGFRAGSQDQAASPVSPFRYENRFRRFVAGVEGSPQPWLKLALIAGADTRRFGAAVPAAFERDTTRLFLDASATVTMSKTHTATLAARRFALPGYGGGSFLEITTYDLVWKRSFGPAVSVALTGRAHHWDFARPVVRDEWWYGSALSVATKLNARCTITAAFALDTVRSDVPLTPGREAFRRMPSLLGAYTF